MMKNEQQTPSFRQILPIVLGTCFYFISNIQRVAVPGTFFNELQTELHVSASGITWFGSAFMYIYAAGQLFAGVLTDRFGGGRVIAGGALFLSLGSLLFPLFSGLSGMYAARILTGIGASLIYLSLTLEALRLWGKNGGIAISFIVMTGFIGGVVANAPFAMLAEYSGYRNVLLATGIISCILYVLYLFFLRTLPPPEHKEKRNIIQGFSEVLHNRKNLPVIGMTGLIFGLYYVLQTVLGKKFLEDSCNFSAQGAAWTLSGMGICFACSSVINAFFSRRLNNRPRILYLIAAGNMTLMLVLILVLLYSGTCFSAVALLLCLLAATSSMSSITIPLLKALNPPGIAGTAASLMNFMFYLCVAVFGNFSGWLINRFPSVQNATGHRIYPMEAYQLLFIVLTGFSIAALILAFRIRNPEKE